MTAASQYWCTETLLVTVAGPQGSSTVALNQPFARIGSHPKSDIVLHGEGIDLRSVYLHATPEGIFCLNLLPSQPVTLSPGNWLSPEQNLQIGPYAISVQLQNASSKSPPEVALTGWGSAKSPLPVFEICCNGRTRDKRRFRARLNLVGRRQYLALQLQGQQVSNFHSALYWDSGKLWCIDLLSSNGTLLQNEPIQCGRLEIGQSLQIGEFSLRFKRLSRSSVHPLSGQAGEPDKGVLSGDAHFSGAEPSPDPQPNPISEASEDTGQDPSLSQVAPVQASSKLRQEERLEEEFAQRSEELLVERQKLDQQWQAATQEIASQVSHLQNESALLAAQKEEVARLRTEWEEQRRILTLEIADVKQELSQRRALLDEPQHLATDDQAIAATPSTESLVQDDASHLKEASDSFSNDSEKPKNGLIGPTSQTRPLSDVPPSTVIEGSFVVEREPPQRDFPSRRLPSPTNTEPPLRPTGRRQSAESAGVAPESGQPKSESESQPLVQAASAENEPQGLTVVERPAALASSKLGESAPRPIAGRRKPADGDRMSAFVTDRMVLRQESRRFWLKVLWGVAALGVLFACAALGIILLSSGLISL